MLETSLMELLSLGKGLIMKAVSGLLGVGDHRVHHCFAPGKTQGNIGVPSQIIWEPLASAPRPVPEQFVKSSRTAQDEPNLNWGTMTKEV